MEAAADPYKNLAGGIEYHKYRDTQNRRTYDAQILIRQSDYELSRNNDDKAIVLLRTALENYKNFIDDELDEELKQIVKDLYDEYAERLKFIENRVKNHEQKVSNDLKVAIQTEEKAIDLYKKKYFKKSLEQYRIALGLYYKYLVQETNLAIIEEYMKKINKIQSIIKDLQNRGYEFFERVE